jgi:predicted AAA+ superfamily ATPase
MQGVSESLAGRCAVLSLNTLSRAELLDAGLPMEETSYIFQGGYPELHVGAESVLWFPAYVATYLERDVRNILRVVELRDFNRFIRAFGLWKLWRRTASRKNLLYAAQRRSTSLSMEPG